MKGKLTYMQPIVSSGISANFVLLFNCNPITINAGSNAKIKSEMMLKALYR